MKKPELKKPQMKLQPPPFLADVVRDMRDRRLILPALALVIAIAAVPVMLKADPQAPVTAAVIDTPDALQVSPAVVTEQLAGVRDYRKRLETFKKKDPFAQQFKVKKESAGKGSGSGSAASGSTAPTPSATGTGETTPSPSPTPTGNSSGGSSPTPTGAPTPPTSSPSGGSGSNGSTNVAPSQPHIEYFTYHVDVKVGPFDNLREFDDVKELGVLASRQRPALIYAGVTEDGNHAIFQPTSYVDSVASDSDGRCIGPHSGTCQYLVLQRGDVAKFHYAPGDYNWRLRLQDIHAVQLHHPPNIENKLTR